MSITQINISNFGSFKDFNWDKAIKEKNGNIPKFKKLNIIYGRNYSGKTTLSRIFRSLQTGKISSNYISPNFVIYGNKGEVNQSTISNHTYEVRVYNRDFVTENLSFLTNEIEGEIKTFAIVGETNNEIESKITNIELKLGSIESKSGLNHELEEKRISKEKTYSEQIAAQQNLETQLRNHAKFLKDNKEYVPAIYDIRNIESDIKINKENGFKALQQTEIDLKIALLKEEVLPDIQNKISINLKITDLNKAADALLKKTISSAQPIQELLNDSTLQSWVKSGISQHKDKRDTCAFCRQLLPDNIWQILDSHFNKESINLESEIDSLINLINEEIIKIPTLIMLSGDNFYVSEKNLFVADKLALDKELNVYINDLESIKSALELKKNNIFQVVTMPIIRHSEETIIEYIKSINLLINKNNNRTITLNKDKAEAKNALRLSDVSLFTSTIQYDKQKDFLTNLENVAKEKEVVFNNTKQEIEKLENEIKTLRSKQKDERKGADYVNQLLNQFFGHDGIKLKAQETPDKTAVKFQIMREDKSAFNLSEGESSLIAFCYFIAKLEEVDNNNKNLIIYIDDPISSLDSNHIFFMFSLIETLIAKPVKKDEGNYYRYEQLFISTHNLDFLKYLKRLSIPKITLQASDEKSKNSKESFIIERNGSFSKISLMPDYLKDYVTEFNYLFHQIYKCRDPNLANKSHEPFYAFGNNLRKFLEAYLFFKYPYQDDNENSSEKIKRFFDDKDEAVALINRLSNEFSHLKLNPEGAFRPVEIPEISKVVNYLLDKLFKIDPDQYNSLLKSIGEPERI